MMLRWLVLLLALANIGYWAVGFPEVAAWLGLPHPEGREPQRLTAQLQPQSIRVLPGAAPNTLPACLSAGPLDEAGHAAALNDVVEAGLPANSWVDMRRGQPGRWAVHMGPFPDAASLQRKQQELQRRNLSADLQERHPTLSPGLLLGQFASESEASRRLDELSRLGVRTAKVEMLQEPSLSYQLRADNLAPEHASRLLAANRGGRWKACSD